MLHEGQRRPYARSGDTPPGACAGPEVISLPRKDTMALSPTDRGLYQPDFEHDACGVAFVVDMHGRRSHRMVEMGLASLCHMEHRGASGAEVNTGDGAGILIQVPDVFYRSVADAALPPAGSYGTGIGFFPAE